MDYRNVLYLLSTFLQFIDGKNSWGPRQYKTLNKLKVNFSFFNDCLWNYVGLLTYMIMKTYTCTNNIR